MGTTDIIERNVNKSVSNVLREKVRAPFGSEVGRAVGMLQTQSAAPTDEPGPDVPAQCNEETS